MAQNASTSFWSYAVDGPIDIDVMYLGSSDSNCTRILFGSRFCSIFWSVWRIWYSWSPSRSSSLLFHLYLGTSIPNLLGLGFCNWKCIHLARFCYKMWCNWPVWFYLTSVIWSILSFNTFKCLIWPFNWLEIILVMILWTYELHYSSFPLSCLFSKCYWSIYILN